MLAYNRFRAAIIFACIAALPACGEDDQGPSPIQLHFPDSGSQVIASVGQEIDVSLPAQGGVYGWDQPSITSDTVRFVGVSETHNTDPSGFQFVTFRFAAVHPGTARLSIAPTGNTSFVPFVVDVTVN